MVPITKSHPAQWGRVPGHRVTARAGHHSGRQPAADALDARRPRLTQAGRQQVLKYLARGMMVIVGGPSTEGQQFGGDQWCLVKQRMHPAQAMCRHVGRRRALPHHHADHAAAAEGHQHAPPRPVRRLDLRWWQIAEKAPQRRGDRDLEAEWCRWHSARLFHRSCG
jgi:hypothetical protein